jgi:DNA-binding NarL/FixJ family response regulator
MEDEAISPLTPRQWEVAGLIAQGLSNREIAQGLGLSVFTVRHHVSVVLRKLRVKTRAQVAFLVGQHQNNQDRLLCHGHPQESVDSCLAGKGYRQDMSA